MHAWLAPVAMAIVLVAGARESRALFGRDDIAYPLRYQVRGVARFRGWKVTGDKPFREVHEVGGRKVEADVLSIDGPDTFHWEKLLADGTPLAGAYAEDGAGRLEMTAFTSSHTDLDGARFPFDRPNGVVRMNADNLLIRTDLSRIHGRHARQIYRPDLDQLRGRVAFKFRGARILPPPP
jgi:hypothetical protein